MQPSDWDGVTFLKTACTKTRKETMDSISVIFLQLFLTSKQQSISSDDDICNFLNAQSLLQSTESTDVTPVSVMKMFNKT